jgi:hypothetical protein
MMIGQDAITTAKRFAQVRPNRSRNRQVLSCGDR